MIIIRAEPANLILLLLSSVYPVGMSIFNGYCCETPLRREPIGTRVPVAIKFHGTRVHYVSRLLLVM